MTGRAPQRHPPWGWLLLVVVLAALGLRQLRQSEQASPTPHGPVVLRFAHNQPTPRILHRAAVLFKELVETRTHGYYDVQIFPAQQLGSNRDEVEQTILGIIELTQQPAAILSLFVPKVMILDFPFLWPRRRRSCGRSWMAPWARNYSRRSTRRASRGARSGVRGS